MFKINLVSLSVTARVCVFNLADIYIEVFIPSKDTTNIMSVNDKSYRLTIRRNQGTFFYYCKLDAHDYKIIGILKQLKFRVSLQHVSVHAGTIIRELLRA
jgi:hypothetical protein